MKIVMTVVVNITYVLMLFLAVYGMWNGPNMPNWELVLRAGGLLIAVNGVLWLFGKLVDRWAEKQPKQTSEEVNRWASFRDDMDKTLIKSIAYSAGFIAVVQALVDRV